MSDLTIPRVHLNGTSAIALISENVDAARAVHIALDALSGAAPNGRDFYPIGYDAFEKARTEHEARCKKLKSVVDELEEIIHGIHEQCEG